MTMSAWLIYQKIYLKVVGPNKSGLQFQINFIYNIRNLNLKITTLENVLANYYIFFLFEIMWEIREIKRNYQNIHIKKAKWTD